jgi:hypothetical protein
MVNKGVIRLYKYWASSYDATTKGRVPLLIEEGIFIRLVEPKKGERAALAG